MKNFLNFVVGKVNNIESVEINEQELKNFFNYFKNEPNPIFYFYKSTMILISARFETKLEEYLED